MPRVAYVGIKNKAKKVKKMYIGVDDVARKVLKGYVGVNNVAHIFYTADWWVPYGLKESNCLGAWQFYHAQSEWHSWQDISNHGQSLYSSSSTWNKDTGTYLGSLGPNSGSYLSPVTAVFWYTGLGNSTEAGVERGHWFHAEFNGCDMSGRIGHINRYANGEWVVETGIRNYPGFCMTYDTNASYCLTGYRGNSTLPSSGVVTFDRSKPQIYLNGNAIGVTYFRYKGESINNMPIATKTGKAFLGGSGGQNKFYLRAAAFFNCGLTARQHSDLAKMIQEIK